MATNKRIQTTELDFDGIKQSLKSYLQGQDQFTDYDFDGAGLNVLLDVLAYNTHYNALYTNLAVNEAFLDSASKRSSVVSKAKELGYTPRSARASTAIVDVLFTNDAINAPTTIEIPRYTPFSTAVDGVNYTFYTTQAYSASRLENEYFFEGVEIKEGTQLSYRFVVENATQTFTIPNPVVDTSTIRVLVQENAQTTAFEVYTASETILSINGTSKVYFLKELDNQYYALEFGDGVVGKQLSVGNVVTVEYLVCNADAPNGARTFQYGGAAPTNTNVGVATTTAAFGGSPAESIEAIKWNAPRSFASQNRCVTLDDYRSVIYSMYPNAQSINVWGGETNNPPTYGDVFISIKPTDREQLSDGEKQYILNDVLGPRRVVTIHPKFVDPEYLRVELSTNIYYNPSLASQSANDIVAAATSAITAYNSTNLSRFNGILKYSALMRAIDQADPSIVSNITTLKIRRDVTPVFNQLTEYTVDIGNPIYNSGVPEQSVVSTAISVLNTNRVAYIEDLPTEGSDVGRLRLFYYVGSQKTYVRDVGTVTYSTGVISVTGLVITGLVDPTFTFTIKPQSNDIVSARNQIVNIDPSLLSVSAVIDTPAEQYKFTSSRN